MATAPIDPDTDETLRFLKGGGELGARMRTLDWATTALGPIQGWSQSLRSAASICIGSRFPIVVYWGPQRVVLYNDAYAEILGQKHPWALGRTCQEVWSEIWGVIAPMLDSVVATGQATWSADQLLMLERRGFPEECYFSFSFSPVSGEDGNVEGIFTAVIENTGRVLGERRLGLLTQLAALSMAPSAREACEQAMRTLEGAPDVPFALAYLKSQGVEELVTQTPGAEAALASAQPQHVMQLPIPDGRVIVGANPRRPLDRQQTDFLELVAGQFATAIANARAYAEERRRAEALDELDRAKTAFFSNVSHEFRTPLTLMLGPLEDLLSRDDAPDRPLLSLIFRNGQRLLRLVNTLLDYSRIEAGRAHAQFEPVDLGTFTAELASNFRSACERAGIGLKIACAPGAVAWVDRDMWEKIVFNLLSNAFKFTLQGSIEISVREQPKCIELAVRDTGVGIPSDSIGRIFDRFHRVEGQRGRSFEGSGIGLALVQEQVKLHGGAVSVESAPDRGSLFTVTIPKGTQHLPAGATETVSRPVLAAAGGSNAAAYLSEVSGWLPELADAPQPAAAGSPRILIADDNADLREYIARLLAPSYRIEQAADGEEALAKARALAPDVLICDVMMPKLDGLAVVKAIRSDAALAMMPVVLLSARAGEEARLEGLRHGADDYLAKPFSARELQVRIAALLQSRELRQRALAAQQASDQRYQTLFESMDEGYCLIEVLFDANGAPADYRFLEINPAFEKQTGLKDARGRRMRDLAPAHEQHWFDIYGRVARSGEAVRFENQAAALGRWYEVCAFRVGAPELNRVGIVFNDITGRKRSERALQDADRRKDEFLATLAHELRNPLAPITHALFVLQGSAQAEPDAAPLAVIDRQIKRLTRLVDDLLDSARISSGALRLQRRSSLLSRIIRDALETVDPLIRAAQHRVELQLHPQETWVNADPARLEQVLGNLLSNACKYTDAGGKVSITTRIHGESVEIDVADNGSGLPPDSLESIFEMFNRGPAGKREFDGLGIGLALARRLVELHDGTLSARSEGLGKGSVFTLRVPTIEPPAPSQRAISSAASLSAIRVLVVDDNQDAAQMLSLALQALGAEVGTAFSGIDAISAFDRFRPAVVLLDLGMPGMDGYEVARILREKGPAELRLVALSGWGQELDVARTRKTGFDHHLVKPASITQISVLLKQIRERV